MITIHTTEDDGISSNSQQSVIKSAQADEKSAEKVEDTAVSRGKESESIDKQEEAQCKEANNFADVKYANGEDKESQDEVHQYTSKWLKENTNIHGWLSFFIFAIALGGLISAFSSVATYNAEDYAGSIWLGSIDVFLGFGLLAIAIYTIYAFCQRKPNAVFYGRLYVILVFVTNIISVIGSEDAGFSELNQAVRGIIWGTVWFFYLLLSNQVQEIIPKSFRKVKTADWSILAVFIVIPILCFAIGVAKLNSKGYSTESITPLENPLTDTVVVDNEMEGEDRIEEKTPEEKNLSFLKKAITEANDSYPMKVEDGVVAKKCYLDGDFVMYDYECDEDVVDMDILSQNKSNVKRVIKKNLKNADAETLMFKRMCEKANKGIGYKYIGKTSGKAVFIKFSCQELKNYSK